MIRTRKRHFQLLELMVAAFILLVCIAPVMRIFTSMYLSQHEIIRQNQRDHLAHVIHAELTEQLYKRQIALPSEEKAQPIVLSDSDILDQLKKLSYQLTGELTIVNFYTPKGQDHPVKYLAKLVIKLKDISPNAQAKNSDKKFENQDPTETFYDYSIYIDAGFREKDNNQQSSDQNSSDQDSDGGSQGKSQKSPKKNPSSPKTGGKTS